MFYYNVTCHVEDSVKENWLKWMKEFHIPKVMKTGCFKESKLLELAEDVKPTPGSTFAVQYVYEKPEDFEKYVNEFAEDLRKETFELYGHLVQAFRTNLEILEQFNS